MDVAKDREKITSNIPFYRMLSRRTYRRPIRGSCEREPPAGSTFLRIAVWEREKN